LKLRSEALSNHLAKQLLPVYLLAGDETLLVQEAADAIRAAARKAGFADRELLFAERGFDWAELTTAGASLSLFASKRLIELRLKSSRPGADGAAALAAYAAAPSPDNLLLIVAPKFERGVREAAWVKAVADAGAVIEIWPVERTRLPEWLTARARARGLVLDPDAAALISDRVEGNLLAAAQEIDKLALIASGPVDAEAAQAAVGASARYDVFGCVDTALEGDAPRALAMLAGLRAEGTEPTLIAWALARDIRLLAHAALEAAQRRPATAFPGTWPKRRPLLQAALKRLGIRAAITLLLHAATADRIVKGQPQGKPWETLAQLVAMLAGALPVTPVRKTAA
jgi:DNA polymerase-3 subunit delta